MREKLRHRIYDELEVPTDHPAIPEERDETRYLQPDRRAHYVRFGFWLAARIFAALFLLTATLDFEFSELFTNIVDVSVNWFQWVPGLSLLPDYWFAIFTWAIFLGEFSYGASIYLLELKPRSQWFFFHGDGIGSREGLITIREKYTAWRNIQTFSLKQNPMQTFLGVANIVVRVAGADKEEKEMPKRAIVFRDIRDGKELYQQLVQRLAIETKPQPAAKTPSEPDTLVAAKELLAETRFLYRDLTERGRTHGMAEGFHAE